jgi:phospholipase C
MPATVANRQGQRYRSAFVAVAIALLGMGIAGSASSADRGAATDRPTTASPIKHVIVVIGENQSFDHLYGTHVPPSGDSISNLLVKGIVRPDGSPGPHFAKAQQFTTSGQTSYFISVATRKKTRYTTLPAPTLNGAPNNPSPTSPPFTLPEDLLAVIEPSLEPGDLFLLTTGATGAAGRTGPDPRIVNGTALPNGPFQLTGPNLPYDSYVGDTTHRFYQMWQQSDCSIRNATEDNPTGCLNDLYPFVVTTYAGPMADRGGGNSMAFYNVQHGDAPLLKKLADEYTISDNYHQPAMGGTGLQHVFLGAGDDVFWSDGNGNPTVPPAAQIANPNPLAGTNNQYSADGRFSNCSDPVGSPGVLPIVRYLDSLGDEVKANCDNGHYYMLNNTNPGFLPNGQLDTAGIANGTSLPPSSVRTIGDALNERGISWAYYAGAYNDAANPMNALDVLIGQAYCKFCNFEAYASSIMGNPTQRSEHIKDAADFFTAVASGTLPAVSFVKPDGLIDGSSATSKLDLFEGMLQKILDSLAANPGLEAQTALFITFDEGGGYYDSGFIQPIDFFGDGPRVPLVVVSPYSKGGHVAHSYADHVSILKFIERNWHLAPLSARSRDNLPNPIADEDDPYVPVNGPAISDLFVMFEFQHDHDHHNHD